MPPDLTPLLLLPLLVVGLLVFGWYNAPSRRRKRMLRRASTVPIGKIRSRQLVKVSGRVRKLESLLEGPLTGRTCVAYWALVERRVSGGPRTNHWETMINECRFVDFLVEDDTGVARLDLDRAALLIVLDASFRSGFLNDADPALEAYLQRFGQKSTGFFGFNKTLRYREGVIEPGEMIAALGSTRTERDPDPSGPGEGYRKAPRRPVLCSPEGGRLLLSDDPSVIDSTIREPDSAEQAATDPLPCPHCHSRRGFLTVEGGLTCLECNRSFDA